MLGFVDLLGGHQGPFLFRTLIFWKQSMNVAGLKRT